MNRFRICFQIWRYTHSARLPLVGEQLKFLGITELHIDLDSPLLVILIFLDTNLASTPNTWKQREEQSDQHCFDLRVPTKSKLTIESGGEPFPNASNQSFECRLPFVLISLLVFWPNWRKLIEVTRHTLLDLIFLALDSIFFSSCAIEFSLASI